MLKEKQHDISIIGFDDIKISKYMSPALTTIRIEQESKGELAQEILTNHITNAQNRSNVTFIDGVLIVRESTYLQKRQ